MAGVGVSEAPREEEEDEMGFCFAHGAPCKWPHRSACRAPVFLGVPTPLPASQRAVRVGCRRGALFSRKLCEHVAPKFQSVKESSGPSAHRRRVRPAAEPGNPLLLPQERQLSKLHMHLAERLLLEKCFPIRSAPSSVQSPKSTSSVLFPPPLPPRPFVELRHPLTFTPATAMPGAPWQREEKTWRLPQAGGAWRRRPASSLPLGRCKGEALTPACCPDPREKGVLSSAWGERPRGGDSVQRGWVPRLPTHLLGTRAVLADTVGTMSGCPLVS